MPANNLARGIRYIITGDAILIVSLILLAEVSVTLVSSLVVIFAGCAGALAGLAFSGYGIWLISSGGSGVRRRKPTKNFARLALLFG